jgi:hypothetical protein
MKFALVPMGMPRPALLVAVLIGTSSLTPLPIRAWA